MISASHNPYYDNGIKLINSRGEKMGDAIIADIEDYLDGKMPEIPLKTGKEIGCTVDYASGRNRYTGYIISLARNSYKDMRIGIDSSNGSTWMLAKNIFETLGAKCYVIGNEPDGFNINKDCGSTHPEALISLVKSEALDIGFAFDGDADRCLAVDSDGNLLSGDHILYFAGKYLKSRDKLTKNTVVTTVMSNMGLYKAFEREGISYVKTDVGDRFVYEAIAENGYCLGGEESGHIIFSKYASTGDGLITAIQIMDILLDSKRPSNKLADGLVIYPQLTKNVRVEDKDAALADPEVQAAKADAEALLGERGRVLLRKSGTEPVIRVMCEADDRELCEKVVDMIAEKIK
jgi:phosphoglucosamine mutase